MRRFAWTLLVTAALYGSGAPVAAQDAPSLDRVEELASQGRAEEAREVLLAWWAASAASANRRDAQRGLWLRGRLTVDPAQADLDFRRLVIEYPGGPYSDLALFRLAQSAYAAGDSLAAVGNVIRLAREYPTSAARREAEAWLATAGPAPPRLAPVVGDPAAQDSLAPGLADPAAQDTLATDAPAGDAVAAGAFTVQLGAFSSQGRAEALQRQVADAGFDARLVTVPGSPLIRVRVGVFDAQEGAYAILRRLQDLGFTAALARDANREERAIR